MMCLEYSFNQKCFHIDTLEKSVHTNLKNFVAGHHTNDYKIIAVADDYEKINAILKNIEHIKQGEKK